MFFLVFVFLPDTFLSDIFGNFSLSPMTSVIIRWVDICVWEVDVRSAGDGPAHGWLQLLADNELISRGELRFQDIMLIATQYSISFKHGEPIKLLP